MRSIEGRSLSGSGHIRSDRAPGDTFGPVGRISLAVLGVALLVDLLAVVLGASSASAHADHAASLAGIPHVMAAAAMVAAFVDVVRIGTRSGEAQVSTDGPDSTDRRPSATRTPTARKEV